MKNKFFYLYKTSGITALFTLAWYRLASKKAKCYFLCSKLLSNKIGLEIGGPSSIFKKGHILPIYPIISKLDNCDYAKSTIWNDKILSDMTFKYDKNRIAGKQYIFEATDLKFLKSETYDFIITSHVLEHIANPLLALFEWIRVLKEEGILLLVLPHKDGTFDHKRNVTEMSHLIKDFKSEIEETDLTHLPEILSLHDLHLDPGINDMIAFKKRCEKNFENRGLHHHVFDTSLLIEILNFLNLHILALEHFLPYHIIAIAKKIPARTFSNNEEYFGENADYRKNSPFLSDKKF